MASLRNENVLQFQSFIVDCMRKTSKGYENKKPRVFKANLQLFAKDSLKTV